MAMVAGMLGGARLSLRQRAPTAAEPSPANPHIEEAAPAPASAPLLPAFNEAERDMGRQLHAQVWLPFM
jgi:hypothetical protein